MKFNLMLTNWPTFNRLLLRGGAIVFTAIAFFSCDDNESKRSTKKDMLMQHPWEFRTATSPNPQTQQFFIAAHAGEVWKFDSDILSVTKGNPGESPDEFEWTLTNNGTVLTLTEAGSTDEKEWHVQGLTSDLFKIHREEAGIEVTLEFQKQD